MSTTTTHTQLHDIQLNTTARQSSQSSFASERRLHDSRDLRVAEDDEPPADAFDSIPDGGFQAWTQIIACASLIFWTNGWATTWGVLQAAILRSDFLQVETSTLSFVGSLALCGIVAFSLFWMKVVRYIGTRNACLIGAILMSSGTILASVTLNNLGGLFFTAGVLFGSGACVLYQAGNALPVQWFSSKVGISNGIVKAGGGIGATVLPVAAQALINRVGLPWTFRVIGLLMLFTTVPCSLLLKERRSRTQVSRIEWSLLKDISFSCLCLGGAVSTFALFVPPFFIPLFATSIGLSPSTGAALVAGFGLSSTVGRVLAGFACDKIGPLNTLSITLVINATSMLGIWPVSGSLAPLTIFAVINGMANGSFFSTVPAAISKLAGPDLAAGAMSLGTSFWTPGYLLGSSIAGILITKSGAASSTSIEAYWGAIFYAGSVALLGGALVFISRFRSDKKILKKL